MYAKSLDEILNQMIADFVNYAGKQPSAEVLMRLSIYASCVWGLYRRIEREAQQRFPDTCDSANLEHWAYIFGLTRTSGESDAALLSRLLSRIRNAPAGGNRADYERWAKEYLTDDGSGEFIVVPAVRDVGDAFCYPNAQGPGTIDIAVLVSPVVRILDMIDDVSYQGPVPGDLGKTVDGLLPSDASQGTLVAYDNTLKRWWVRCTSAAPFVETQTCAVLAGSGATGVMEVPSFTDVAYPSLITAISNYIEFKRPVASGTFRVLGVTRNEQAVTMETTGNCDTAAAIASIRSLMNALLPGQTLYRAQLVAECIKYGAANATFPGPETPSADVTATAYEVIRPTTISVIPS